MAVSSLGEGLGRDGDLAGAGLELLGDTYVMCGPLVAHREGDMSTWWLSTPAFGVEAFATHLGTTHRLMAEAFDAPAHLTRVTACQPAPRREPVRAPRLSSTIAHELVHEWLRLDGPAEEVTWFVEGAVDYYSLLLPFRAGRIDQDTFLGEVNIAARMADASPLHRLSLDQASHTSGPTSGVPTSVKAPWSWRGCPSGPDTSASTHD